MFLDETSTRIVGRVPRNHGPNITCLVAVGPQGMLAPPVCLKPRWMTRYSCSGCASGSCPSNDRGTTLVLDNLSVHRMPAVREVIEAAGCHLVFLPAYSPDFNPIELVFTHLKIHSRCQRPNGGLCDRSRSGYRQHGTHTGLLPPLWLSRPRMTRRNQPERRSSAVG